MRPTASHALRLMTSENATIFPGKMGYTWNKILKDATNSKIKMTKNVLTTLRLKKLREMNQGTNDVESYCSNISDENYRSKTRKMLMRLKIEDACRVENRSREEVKRRNTYIKRKIGHLEVFSQYKTIVQRETEHTWDLGKEKTKQKLIHLAQKYQNKPPVSQEKFRGILISDTLINEKFGENPPDMTPDCADIPMIKKS